MPDEVKERPIYPTFGSEKEVIEYGKTIFPKKYWNQMVSLLNSYRNTVFKQLEQNKSTS